jgi:hypothetical protein
MSYVEVLILLRELVVDEVLTRAYFLCRERLFLICRGENAEMHALKKKIY